MFVHLHVHSPYSFLDGASPIDEIVARASELGMSSMAITDHDNLSAAVRFVKAAKKAGIKPIIGAELTMEGGFHLTVLCRDKEGYRNLCAALTEAHLNNPRRSPRTSLDTLAAHKNGLLVLTGCRRGLISTLILQKRFSEAREVAEKYRRIFGQDSLFVEISETLLPGSRGLNRYLSELAATFGLKTVATNNVHYARKEDFFVHDVLTCIRTLTKLEDVHPERRLNAENYLKSEREMKEELRDYQESLEMTSVIAESCECPLELGVPNFPSFPVPSGFASSKEFLRHLVFQGVQSRYGRVTGEISSRLEHELKVIEQLGYEDYFLVVWDLVRFAEEQKIRHAGRGSAADSAVAYCLGITDVDPIAQNLLFERFLSVERGEKPDIDVDFDSRRRDEVTEYVYRKYGDDYVASVATYNTFQGRAAIRDAGKAMGYAPEEIDAIAKRLPHISAAMLDEAFEVVPELKSLGIPEKKLKTLISVAEKLADFPRFLSTHLGGVVIAKDPISWFSPVEFSAKGVKILEFDKDDVEDLGLVKIDLLALRTLGAIEDSLGYIEKSLPGEVLDYDRISLDDEETFKRLQRADTIGVFQLESPAQRALQARLGADNIEDIVASVALIRPGPIKGDMVEPFIRRRRGDEGVTYLHPSLEPILKKTYGVVLFQEQVIEIASSIAGFTPGEADSLRRVMTHGRSFSEMQKIGELFVKKAVQRGIERDVAEKVFQCIQGYASYGFCEAHARAFGTTAYKTAYLIQHYPAQFFAAILNNEPMGFYPVSTICVEARKHGVKVLGPSINHSYQDVTVEDGQIRLPFKMINGMTEKAMTLIVSERERGGLFKSFSDFTRRVRLERDILKNLILCGAFDEFGISRRALLWNLNELDPRVEVQPGILIAVREGDSVAMPPIADFSLQEKVALEYQILGVGISAHPVELWRPILKARGFTGSAELHEVPPGEFIKVGGIPVRPHRPPTRSGRTVVFLSLEDEAGLIDVTCFENVYKRYGKYLFPGEMIPLGVWGQLQKRGNAFSVVAKSIFPLSYVLNERDT
ncbi:MAG: DNA polymerase III subunit alpha [Candidatus Fermentithermobacillus carboniphilus]|uniref:DNA polymerase III subunit alpha n=1 Tax=Candidatus Fermentithermobacillus carboniphilus TaxID=3085328 RepID=A0AAT9LDZ1_9FIRM|nr:MAG: DNA polymerase III subunit alpha [Candidatus Fermentithermobacillus carboniphilus]